MQQNSNNNKNILEILRGFNLTNKKLTAVLSSVYSLGKNTYQNTSQ